MINNLLTIPLSAFSVRSGLRRRKIPMSAYPSKRAFDPRYEYTS